jgi:hypothetical protein
LVWKNANGLAPYQGTGHLAHALQIRRHKMHIGVGSAILDDGIEPALPCWPIQNGGWKVLCKYSGDNFEAT